MFLFIIRDWLRHLCQEPSLLAEYNTSLGMELNRHLTNDVSDGKPHSDRLLHWRTYVIQNEQTVYSLLYRHYVLDKAIASELVTTMQAPALFYIIASMYCPYVGFAELERSSVWMAVNHDDVIVNQIRQLQPRIKQDAQALCNREDVTDQRIFVDHGLLSSHALFFGLYLTYAILMFEFKISKHEVLNAIMTDLASTLTELKGVLINGQD